MNTETNEETCQLTPWGCLSAVLTDYRIDVSGISAKVGAHIVEDFMESMMAQGYVGKAESNGENVDTVQ